MVEGSTSSDPASEPVMISALEHWSYCPRQCALIHLEQTFDENLYTLRGAFAHERVDQEAATTEAGVRTERAVPLWSDRLGLVGKADVVEFHGDRPYPVEYKSGKKRRWAHEAIQVCAQAMCLEEMLGVSVPEGAVYYIASRRRRQIVFDDALRRLVEDTIEAVRQMWANSELPAAAADRRCPPCSLFESCLPEALGKPARFRGFHGALYRIDDAEEGTE